MESRDCDMKDLEVLKESSNTTNDEDVIIEYQCSGFEQDINCTNNDNLKENKIIFDVGDTIMTRYYSFHQWKYYVGIFDSVKKPELVYSVSYFKTKRFAEGVKFVKPKREDKDSSLPESCIVKSIQLLQISENPEEYVPYHDEDIIYFNN